jgi:hypothetical protein
MIKTIYLHVGNFKTGTSAIQKFCSEQRDQLLENDMDYLEQARPVSAPTNHGKLPLSLLAKYQKFLPDWYEEKDGFETVATAVRDEVENSRCGRILISSEEFYRLASLPKKSAQSSIDDLRLTFSGHEVKVIMYVRKPLDFLKSWYNEVNKGRRPQRRFIDFFYFLNESLLCPENNAKFWRECFGPDCLILEPYCRYGFDHIDRFMELANIQIAYKKMDDEVLVNPTRNERSLEKDRINRIMASCTKAEREQYLRSFVFSNQTNFRLFKKKIVRVNADFVNFCSEEKLSLPDASFSQGDLLLHEEKINRKDVVITNPIRTLKDRILNPGFIQLLKRARNLIS